MAPVPETHFDSDNIIVGIAMLYQGALGADTPTFPADASALVVDPEVWTPLGYTDAGIKFAYSVSNKNITVDEEMAAIDVLPDTEKVVVSLGLAELTLENLNRAIAGGTFTEVQAGAGIAGTKKLTVGSKPTNVKYSYLLVGPGPQGQQRIVQLYRAIATSNAEMTYKRAEKVMIPAEFSGLADSSRDVGDRLFCVIDKTADGTALSVPVANPAAGQVAANTPVALTADPGASIYYTTDGTAPTAQSTLYANPIPINVAKTIKAISILNGESSTVLSSAYTVA